MTLEELQAEAERLFPYPFGACMFVKKKVNWKREMWINEQLKKSM